MDSIQEFNKLLVDIIVDTTFTKQNKQFLAGYIKTDDNKQDLKIGPIDKQLVSAELGEFFSNINNVVKGGRYNISSFNNLTQTLYNIRFSRKGMSSQVVITHDDAVPLIINNIAQLFKIKKPHPKTNNRRT